jgi:hypothetical protein
MFTRLKEYRNNGSRVSHTHQKKSWILSSLDRYDHTRHGLHLNPGGKGKLVQLTADRIRCNSKIPVTTGARSRPFLG